MAGPIYSVAVEGNAWSWIETDDKAKALRAAADLSASQGRPHVVREVRGSYATILVTFVEGKANYPKRPSPPQKVTP